MAGTSTVSRAVLAAGAAGSLLLMFSAGRNQPSVILMGLFTLWVASPFVALALAESCAHRWLAISPRLLHGVMLLVGLGSLAVYGANAVRPFSPRAAAVFLMAPAATWVLGALVLAIGRRRTP